MSRARHAGAGRRVQTSQDSLRATAGWVVDRTLASLAPADTYLAGAVARFEPRDRGLLVELAMGTLRWLRRLDAVIAQASDRGLQGIDPALLTPLRIAVYQLLFLERVPAHAAVNEAVDEARRRTHRGGASFVNAVLRRIARSPRLEDWPVREQDPLRRLAVETSHPDFLVARWLERFGEPRTRALLQANNRPRPLHLLAFRDRGGRELLAESLIDAGVEVDPSGLAPLGLVVRSGDPFETEAFRRGDFYVQDEASQAAAIIPPPRPGEWVLDAAAAPGGKTFALLASEPGIRPVLADVDPARMRTLRRNLDRLGRPLPLAVADGAWPPWSRTFDRVVVDLPCTGTGTLRNHPELKWRISEDEIGRLSRQALAMLEGAASAVGEMGWLIAITCSLEAEENEDVVAALLARRDDFELAELAGLVPPPLDRSIRGPGLWRILPAGDHDGFTLHALRRRRGGEGPRKRGVIGASFS
ncbi:MAG TPA: transcription antitermination factor NusB [Thermoanaerobaculia bacterium]|nr:transcription antitermination factor NusB [Thermoanaerobaculia bacterium]